MTDQEIIAKANAAIAEEFEIDVERLVPTALLGEDLGLDSLDGVDMIVALEQAFDMKIGKEIDMASIQTIGDMHAFILAKKDQMEKHA